MHDHPHKSTVRTGILLLAIATGVAFPQLHELAFLIPYALIIMLFFVFLRITAPLHALDWSHARLLVWNIGFGPAMYALVRTCGGSHELALAALFAALSPTGTAAPVVMGFLDGKVEYVVMAFLLATLSFAVATPFIVPYYLGTETPGIQLKIFQSIGLLIFVPAILAGIVRKVHPESRRWYLKTANVSFMLWCFCLMTMASNASQFVWESAHQGVATLATYFFVTFCVCSGNFLAGWFLGGKRYHRECSQSLGQKNTSLTFCLALLYAPPAIAAAVALGPCSYVIWHNLWNAIQMGAHKNSENSEE